VTLATHACNNGVRQSGEDLAALLESDTRLAADAAPIP